MRHKAVLLFVVIHPKVLIERSLSLSIAWTNPFNWIDAQLVQYLGADPATVREYSTWLLIPLCLVLWSVGTSIIIYFFKRSEFSGIKKVVDAMTREQIKSAFEQLAEGKPNPRLRPSQYQLALARLATLSRDVDYVEALFLILCQSENRRMRNYGYECLSVLVPEVAAELHSAGWTADYLTKEVSQVLEKHLAKRASAAVAAENKISESQQEVKQSA